MEQKGEEFNYTRNQVRLLLEEGPQYYVDHGRIRSFKHENLSLAFENVEQHVFGRIKQAYDEMVKGEYFKALKELRELEMIVDVFLENCEADLNEETVIFLLINLGICFFRYGFYDDAFSCFESCEKRLETGIIVLNRYADKSGEAIEASSFAQQIRLVRLKLIYAKTKLVNGVIFETVNRKAQALKYYKQSICSSFDILLDLVMLVTVEKGLHVEKVKLGKKKGQCILNEKQGGRSLSFHRFPQQNAQSDAVSLEKNSNRQKSNEKTHCQKLSQILESPAEKLLFIFFKNVQEVFPFFRKVYEKNQHFSKFIKLSTIQGIQLPISRIKQAFVKGHSIYSQNLERMLELKPVSFQEIHQSFFKQSLTLEFVLELIIEITLALYQFACLRTQTDAKSKLRDNSAHSEILMNKCLEISYSFLPISAYFVKQIVKKHSDLFGIYRQTIPQYGKMSEQLKFLRSSLNQSQANKLFVPCIRSLKFKKTHKLDSDEDQHSQKPKEREASKPKQRKQEVPKTKRNKKNTPIIQTSGPKKSPSTLFSKILKLIELDQAAKNSKVLLSKPTSKISSRGLTGFLSNIRTASGQQLPKPPSSVNLKKTPRSGGGNRRNFLKN